MKISAALLAAVLSLIPAQTQTVSVAYAGSLTAVMEGPVARALEPRGLRFEGEGKGSRALAGLIRAGLRKPDVFVSADPALINGLASSYTIFGSAAMVIAYSSRSPHAALLARAARGNIPLLEALTAAGMRVGRTDPRLDPKGARTVTSVQMLGSQERLAVKARVLLANAPEYPEEDLAVRVETGQLDAGFFYSTEIARPGLRVIDLPAPANLSSGITYALAVMPGAPHALAARSFARFILTGEGRHLLELAGVHYFAQPRIVHGKRPHQT